jgi:hypothetical protein
MKGEKLMQDWKFLIQKEGDRLWQSPQDSSLEIEPGMYRIVAHSTYPNQEIEIRIVQEGIQADVFATTRHTQVRRTNSQGLLMVLPYTDLQPGEWEIRCTGDIMTELLGKPWQQSLQLSVMVNPREIVPTPTELLSQKIEPLLQENKAVNPTLSIVLEEDTIIRTLGETVEIGGRIVIDQTEELPLTCKLIYQLRRTQTGEKVFKVEYSLQNQELLNPFYHQLEILDEPPITFLLGEISLETAEGICLAKESFTISTDITLVETPGIDRQNRHLLVPKEVTVIPKPTLQTVTTNYSVLPPKLAKERRTQTKKLELPPIRLNSTK